MVGVCVDDFCIISDLEEELIKLKAYHWLGLTINHNLDNGTLSISDELNMKEALKDLGISDCKPIRTPSAPGYKTVPTDDTSDASTYIPLSASSRYLTMVCTYYASSDTIWSESPNIVLTPIVHTYKLSSASLGTYKELSQFRRGNRTLHLKAYCDADFAGEPDGNDKPMRSTSGLIVYLHGVSPQYWKTQLQLVTTTSTKKAEYHSADLCSRVMIDFRQLCAT